jgi:hypothetical protein
LGWLPRFFGNLAILQVITAEHANEISNLVGGRPDYLCSTKCENPDEIFGVLQAIYIPEGNKQSRWSGGSEFVEFAEKFGRSDACFGLGDLSGLTLEAPFGDQSALIRLWTTERHPQLGRGLLVTLETPFDAPNDQVSRRSAMLNYAESTRWMDFPQLGCWGSRKSVSTEGKSRLVHVSFVPNCLYQRGLATNYAFWSVARARWARRELWPNLQDSSMADILQQRTRLASLFSDPDDLIH